MNLIGSALYDPASAASKATSSLLAMTALDTANLRLAITVPAHGKVRFKMRCVVTGATTVPTILLGVMNGVTVLGRVAPMYEPATANIATQNFVCDAEFTVTGLSPGAMNVDAAYAVQVVVASTNIKYGGANTNAGANAWGGFLFEAWDPQPIPTAAAGASGGLLISGSNAGTTTLGALTVTGATTFTGATSYTGNVSYADGITIAVPSTVDRAGFDIAGNGAGAGIRATGGATGPGVFARGGATSGNGVVANAQTSGAGISATGVGGNGITATGAGTGHGIQALSGTGATGDGIRATAQSTNGNGVGAAGTGTGSGGSFTGGASAGHGIAATGGAGSGDGIIATGGSTGHGIQGQGGATSGSGIVGNAQTSGQGISATGAGTGNGINATGGATGNGVVATGGATSGHGVVAQAATLGEGLSATGAGTGNGFKAVSGAGATGSGIRAFSNATNGSGLSVSGVGTGSDILGNLSGSVGSISSTGLTALWGYTIEGTTTAEQMMRGYASALLSKASGLAGVTAVYRNVADTKDRITATVDASGNRTAITLDLTP